MTFEESRSFFGFPENIWKVSSVPQDDRFLRTPGSILAFQFSGEHNLCAPLPKVHTAGSFCVPTTHSKTPTISSSSCHLQLGDLSQLQRRVDTSPVQLRKANCSFLAEQCQEDFSVSQQPHPCSYAHLGKPLPFRERSFPFVK